MSERKPYPSDLSDARWALIEPTLTAWRNARLERRPTGQPAKVDLRDVFNAILYINRTGIPWKYLPHDFPSHGTVYAYYAAWRDEGIFAQLNYDLTGLARVKEGRKPEPTASVIDTRSVKTSTNVPLTSQGTDAAKKIVGRKRGILTDTIGLILAVTVAGAGLRRAEAVTSPRGVRPFRMFRPWPAELLSAVLSAVSVTMGGCAPVSSPGPACGYRRATTLTCSPDACRPSWPRCVIRPSCRSAPVTAQLLLGRGMAMERQLRRWSIHPEEGWSQGFSTGFRP
ncbi:hypothetical protein EES41_00265 [Streptomyces sp. ADI95-16]|nr:hypothetical protein EES41_00265 [Streptomyces sp. ADI95-16]